MKMSSAVQIPLLLVLIAGCFVVEGARHRLKVRKHRVTYKIDWWDTGRADPYRIIFKKNGLKSVYRFFESGRLKSLNVGTTTYTFSYGIETANSMPEVQASDTGSRMLLESEEDEALEEVHSDHRRLYDCEDCEETWDTMCDVGVVDVCFWVPLLPFVFNDDAQTSLTMMCKGLGAACAKSSYDPCEGTCIEGPAPEPTPAPFSAPTPSPVDDSTPDTDACNPNPCQNGGSCSLDPAGGHTCSCASNYGGMTCQTATSSLDSFYIELNYIGTWTDARRAVFQSAADRWSEVITHVPCGGSTTYPAGRLLISATLEAIDGPGNVLGSAGPTRIWNSCPSISYTGSMRFDIDDIASMENQNIFEGVILHEMGHVIGVGTLWGSPYATCSTCRANGNPAWTCPAALSAYADIGGSDANILELDGSTGTRCGHLDETIFTDELMTGYVNSVMYLSKMTAAILDDLDYTVDASAVDAYTLPSERGALTNAESEPATTISDTAVDTIILSTDDDGNVVEELDGFMMVF